MGSGMCSRRQKGLLQTGFFLVALACLGSGAFLYNHLQQKVKEAEAVAVKYKQQQEVLSAQLQVVYEHRSRLERSLQKERGEHKKTKEDFLVYKLEAQEALNKEKQDSMNRYGALSTQHKILKNQHEEIKKQLLDLQLQHNGLKLEHRKAVEAHNQKYSQLQREKESEVVGLQDTVHKLREESKLLRKAHQDVHSQLLNAQVQMEEFRQLKETLQKMPSFKDVGMGKGQPKQLAKEQRAAGFGLLQLARPKSSMGNEARAPMSPPEQAAAAVPEHPLGAQFPDVKYQRGEVLHEGQVPHSDTGPFGEQGPAREAHLQRDGPIIRFTRMVNSIQSANQDEKAMQSMLRGSEESLHTEAMAPDFQPPPASDGARGLDKQLSVGEKRDPEVQSWQDIVHKVHVQMDEEQASLLPKLPYSQRLDLGARPGQVMANGHQVLGGGQQRGGEQQQPADWGARKGGADEEELQMDAGMIEREDHSPPRKETLMQHPNVPGDVGDPAQDPNNQGEDEFEEAELERPDFEEKAGQADQVRQTKGPANEPTKEKTQEDAKGPRKMADDPIDDYQEDQEQDLEDHGGEVDDADDLELVQELQSHVERDGRKDYY
ncbi:Golgi integral membrane protein 4-like isoform X2 [Varanus komodoensis]|nr:Golgi integral membrane protein 4-like isoform X2 [Varanus komodoensis]